MNPDDLPNPIKQGIAPALSASSCGTYWGDCGRKPGTTDKQWMLLGGGAQKRAPETIRERLEALNPKTKAREVMQVQLQPKGCEDIPNPEWTEDPPPTNQMCTVMAV